jgi:methylenetetrahydrofolate dehydrogenase (NADP+)/methenyltetrahydrofolate cyclohydrolase
MKIDGRTIADGILTKLRDEVAGMAPKPILAVILAGDDPASVAYIKQKQKAAETIGAKLLLSHDLSDIEKLNHDPSVHGLIIQRPLPKELGDVQQLLNTVKPGKDVDGFVPDSPFEVPVAMAVWEILKSIRYQVAEKKVVIVGRGETAGAPIARYFAKQHFATSQIHSQTPNPEEIMKDADVIISCVGKSRVVTREAVKPGAILISVGIWRDSEGKLHGDYEEDEIADIASAYTPTPGGVGPVNVACLMRNLVHAAQTGHS